MRNAFLAGRIFNVPLLVTVDYADTVTEFLCNRHAGIEIPYSPDDKPLSRFMLTSEGEVFDPGDFQDNFPDDEPAPSALAVIPVHGSLASKGGSVNGMSSSMRSYPEVKNEVNASLHNEKVVGIFMDYDTPGGEAAGNIEFAEWLNEQSLESGKPIWSMANHDAASAGYAMFSAGSRLIASPSARLGSIGVVYQHTDVSQALKKNGRKVTFIHAGKYKVSGNSASPLSKADEKRIQTQVDYMYDRFTGLVANNLDMDQQIIRDTEAAVLNSSEALDLGLIDSVMTSDDALAEMFEFINRGKSSASQSHGEIMTKKYDQAELDSAANEAASEAIAANNNRWAKLLAHANGANLAAVTNLATASIDLDTALAQMDFVAPAASAEPNPTERSASGGDSGVVNAADIEAIVNKQVAEKLQAAIASASDTGNLPAGPGNHAEPAPLTKSEQSKKDFEDGAAAADRYIGRTH